ncbi:hypothetical protein CAUPRSCDRAFT_10884 [Caulochytrium protostelioides]|uniref:DUF4874 domain-containing protein n=1 Tax=Caulochytrium protostelioides TaxID=1555241 RepID=A0A4P9X130_9FUNG|nr:hypothetical protein CAUPRSCDRAFT_10884 [Caulochytrium protostelioides]
MKWASASSASAWPARLVGLAVAALACLSHVAQAGTPVPGGWSTSYEIPALLANKDAVNYPTFERMQTDVATRNLNLGRLVINVGIDSDRTALVAAVKEVLDSARRAGMYLIPRFAYDTGTTAGYNPDLAVVAKDLEACVAIFESSPDHIYALQAGFLGKSYSEWWGPDMDEPAHFSSQCGTLKQTVIKRLERFMQVSGRTAQLRYPRDHALYAPDAAFGLHDDCILSQGWDGDDSGTFGKGVHTDSMTQNTWPADDLAAAKQWTVDRSTLVGGESCTDAGSAPDCPALKKWVQTYKACYINVEYPTSFKSWVDPADANHQCFLEIGQIMAQNCPAGHGGAAGTAAPVETLADPAPATIVMDGAPPAATYTAAEASTSALAANSAASTDVVNVAASEAPGKDGVMDNAVSTLGGKAVVETYTAAEPAVTSAPASTTPTSCMKSQAAASTASVAPLAAVATTSAAGALDLSTSADATFVSTTAVPAAGRYLGRGADSIETSTSALPATATSPSDVAPAATPAPSNGAPADMPTMTTTTSCSGTRSSAAPTSSSGAAETGAPTDDVVTNAEPALTTMTSPAEVTTTSTSTTYVTVTVTDVPSAAEPSMITRCKRRKLSTSNEGVYRRAIR